MTDFCRISIISTVETAFNKLKKAKIGVYDVKKVGARVEFSIKDKDCKKAFAIFSKPCYNIFVQASRRKKLLSRVIARVGLIVGAMLFAFIAVASNLFVLRIEVCGNGAYLRPEVKRILYSQSFYEFKPYRSLDTVKAKSQILAIPQVIFCNIQKRGSILLIDVRVDDERADTANLLELKADRAGVVKSIVVVCGTNEVRVGDAVGAGDVLIGAYTVTGETKAPCLAVGYAEIECRGAYEYACGEESDTSQKAAYSKANLYAENIISRTHSVTNTKDGVIYLIEFTYLQKLSINME